MVGGGLRTIEVVELQRQIGHILPVAEKRLCHNEKHHIFKHAMSIENLRACLFAPY
jgi:hypothetical protein